LLKAAAGELIRTTEDSYALPEVPFTKSDIGCAAPITVALLSEDNIHTTNPLLQELMPKLNAYLRSIGSQKPMTDD